MNVKAKPQPQRGFSLLEVLVSIVILSIALLGLAGMMLSTLKSNHSAYQRSQATWLAYDIIDRMRATQGGNAYDIALGAAAPSGDSLSIVQQDLSDWKRALGATLPAGDGSVDVNTATDAVTVIIQWDDSRGVGGSDVQQFEVDTRL